MSSSLRTCIYHESAPAIAVCSECDGDICGECHGASLQGLAICAECRSEMLPETFPWERIPDGLSLKSYIQTLFILLGAPRTSFLHLSPQGGWGRAATFGITSIALGSTANTLWQKAFSTRYSEIVARYIEEFGGSASLAELTIFAAIPLGAIFIYFLHTALFYFTLRLFGVSSATWSVTARITGYALGAYILLLLPPIGEFSLGHFLMVIWLFNLEVSAVRIYFRLGFWRSMAVVFLPFMLFVMAIG